MRIPLSLGLFSLLVVAPGLATLAHAGDERLWGAFKNADWPTLSFSSFQSGKFADDYTDAFESHLGWRGASTYIDNTMRLKLLGAAKPSSDAQLGKEGVLYHMDDLIHFSKRPAQLPSADDIAKMLDTLAAMQRRMASRGQALIPVMVPGKGALYPAQVPDGYQFSFGANRPSDKGVYQAVIAGLQARGVNYVDGRAILTSGQYPVDQMWGRQARHWSHFSVCLVMREVRVTYTKMLGTNLPDYPCTLRNQPRVDLMHEDYDLVRISNAWGVELSSPTEPEVAYPPVAPPLLAAPSMLLVGTSFFGSLGKTAVESQLFGPVDISFYNKQFLNMKGGPDVPVRPHTDSWRSVTHGRDIYLVDLYETYFPGTYLKEFLAEFGDELGPPPPSHAAGAQGASPAH